MAAKPNPIVIVPGMLGSELRLYGRSIWSDRKREAARVVRNPSLLLPWVPLSADRVLDFYDPLLQCLRYGKHYDDGNLFLFAYDWRQGLETTAESLRVFVQNVVRVKHTAPIIFVAHSFGCLVVRFALARSVLEPSKVKLVIAAGPPMLGSARAFRSVVELPSFQWFFDIVFASLRRRWRAGAARLETPLVKCLMTVRSVLETMPPRGSSTWAPEGSAAYSSGFEWNGWPPSLAELLRLAEGTQTELQTTPWPSGVTRKLILSAEHPTDVSYELDSTNYFRITGVRAKAGDGRVLAESARFFGTDEPELSVWKGHDELLFDDQTLNYLRSNLP